MTERGAVHVVINPVSGRSPKRGVLADLCERIEASGFSMITSRTSGPGDARRAATQACRAGARAVIAVGGDGTINEVASGMEGEGVPILVVPYGTENILAKYFGTALNAEVLWRTFSAGREVRLDLPVMNGRHFLLLGGIGFDAEVVLRLTQARKGHISYLTYVGPIWQTLWGHPFHPLHVEADGAKLFEGPGLVFVGNVPRYAIGLRILGRALPDDGLLDLCVFRCSWAGRLVRHAANVLFRRHIGGADVVYAQARHVRVWSDHDSVPIQLDGDVAGCLPAEFEMTSSRARFLVRPDRPELPGPSGSETT